MAKQLLLVLWLGMKDKLSCMLLLLNLERNGKLTFNYTQTLGPIRLLICFACRFIGWERQENWEERCQWVTVVSVVTESILPVAVTQVVCIITESTLRNSKHSLFVNSLCSHPGYFGKKGQRHFHLQRNQYFKPTINLDKLWTLVPEDARKASTAANAVIIDVVKSVCLFIK